MAVFIYGLIAMFPVGFLASFIVSHGISIGREREARDLAAGIFAGSGFLWVGTLAGMMVYTAIRDVMKYWKEPASTPADDRYPQRKHRLRYRQRASRRGFPGYGFAERTFSSSGIRDFFASRHVRHRGDYFPICFRGRTLEPLWLSRAPPNAANTRIAPPT
jgi:hypothetical protein